MTFIDQWFNWIDNGIRDGKTVPMTDAPTAYIMHMALFTLSCMVKRNLYIEYGPRKLFPNMWCVLLGSSSRYRKSTTISLSMKLLQQIDPNFVLPNEFSLEELLVTLSYNPQGVFVIDEFSTFYSQFGRSYMSGGISLLTELYDRFMPYPLKLRSGTYDIIDPFLNLASATTLSSFEDSIDAKDIKSGFLPRYYFVVANKRDRGDITIPGASDPKLEAEIIEYLQLVSQYKGKLTLTPEAGEVYDNFYRESMKTYASDLETMVGPFITRLLTMTLKFAILFHVSKPEELPEDTISPWAVECATKIVHGLIANTKTLFSDIALNTYQQDRRDVLAFVDTSSNGAWVTKSELLRHLKMAKDKLNSILSTLQEEGTIEEMEFTAPGARKPTHQFRRLAA